MCKDPALSYLNGLGYNVVRYPSADIRPLDLIGQAGRTSERLGPLKQLLKNERRQPSVKTNIASAPIDGQVSNKIDATAGFSILGTFLKAMGGDGAISGHFGSVRKVQFKFTDVKTDRVEPTAIGEYVDGAELETGGSLWAPFFRKEGRLFVITEVIKSKQILVQLDGDRGVGGTVSAPVLQQAIGGKITVDLKNDAGLTLGFTGEVPLIFGFKCLEVRLDGGHIELALVRPSPAAAFPSGATRSFGPPMASVSEESTRAAGAATGSPLLVVDDLLDLKVNPDHPEHLDQPRSG